MPIKPENKSRYPADWKAIRARILERASNCCETCKAPNRTAIGRGTGKDEGTYMVGDTGAVFSESGEEMGFARGSEYNASRITVIVLTIGHLDHTPENCDESNLRAWCQKCHLAYDQEMHQRNAAATRRNRRAVADLFMERPK